MSGFETNRRRVSRRLRQSRRRRRTAHLPCGVRFFTVAMGAVVAVLSMQLPLANALESAATQSGYSNPVEGALIVDHFRPPETVYGAGNRGIDEITRPGAPVMASASGDVIFAGQVAGTLHLTIRHSDGLRTSYSFLASLLVQQGDRVDQGQVIATSSGTFHFGVRDTDGSYLDPEALLGGTTGSHLVPGADDGAQRLRTADEFIALEAMINASRQAGATFTARVAALGNEILSADPSLSLLQLGAELEAFRRSQDHCTPEALSPPPATARRIVVLVGGLGSTDTTAAVDRVNVTELGYASADVLRFSYRGGQVPRRGGVASGRLDGVPQSTYTALDTEIDLHHSAAALADLLQQVSQAEPGVPIDVIAHSQGGVVARLALQAASERDELPGNLGVVVTLGTPHQGADLATAVTAIGPRSPSGQLFSSVAVAGGLKLDPSAPAIAQLSETSSVAAELARPIPEGVHLLSIGASGDLTVAAIRTQTPGADQALIHLTGVHAHDELPASAATTREIALARAGLRPSCVAMAQGFADVVTAHTIARAEDALGLAIASNS